MDQISLHKWNNMIFYVKRRVSVMVANGRVPHKVQCPFFLTKFDFNRSMDK